MHAIYRNIKYHNILFSRFLLIKTHASISFVLIFKEKVVFLRIVQIVKKTYFGVLVFFGYIGNLNWDMCHFFLVRVSCKDYISKERNFYIFD